MVSLQKIDDSSVKFVFTDSDHYLVGNGEIVVPINSLSLVIDESEMVTFKKSATGDPFISFRADNSNLGTKEAIEQFYKQNMVGDSGISQEEVQDMIDSSMSGVPSSQVVEQLRTDVDTISGNTYTKTQIDGFLSNAEGMLTTISGEVQTNSANIQDINDTIDEKEEVIASALTQLRQDVSDIDEKEEVIASALTSIESAVTAVSNDLNTLSGAVIDNEYTVSQSLNDLNSRLIAVESGGSVDLSQYWTSAQTQSAIDNVKAYYVDFGVLTTQGIHDADWDGFVNAINAHRPIYAGLGNEYYTAECLFQDGNQIIMTASNNLAHFFYTFTKNGSENYGFTYETRRYTTQAEKDSWTSGATNASTALTNLGGLKLVKIYQADYDVLATKDENTLYIIPDGDSGSSHWSE